MTTNLESMVKDLKITHKELDRLSKCFEDPEFRKLFHEYAEEISDPENKKLYEQEIAAYENEQGHDVTFVKPDGKYVLKVRHWIESADSTEGKCEKIFINVASCDKVEEPSIETKMQENKKGYEVQLPHCFTPPRDDYDKSKKLSKVVDICFHPKTFDLGEKTKSIKDLIGLTALYGVSSNFGYQFGKDLENAKLIASLDNFKNKKRKDDLLIKCSHVLKGVKYKGMPKNTIIRKRREDYAEFIQKRDEENDKLVAEMPHMKKIIDIKYGVKEPVKEPVVVNPKIPKYTIVHGSNFDITNSFSNIDDSSSKIPDYLKVRIELPGITSASQFDVDLKPKQLVLRAEKPMVYELDLDLPYEVNVEDAVAKFEKNKSLTLTLNVVKKICKEEPLVMGNDIGIEELSPDKFVVESGNGSIFEVQSVSDDLHESTENVEPDLDSLIREVPELHLVIPKENRLMPVKFRQDVKTFSVIICVKHILQPSLSIDWCSIKRPKVLTPEVTRTLHKPLFMAINAQSRGAGGCTIDWSVILQCPMEIEHFVQSMEDEDESADEEAKYDLIGEKPKLVSLSVNEYNAVLVFQKPESLHLDCKETVDWWSAIATGRTLRDGMQMLNFGGLSSCVPSHQSEISTYASMLLKHKASLCESPAMSIPNKPHNSRFHVTVTDLTPDSIRIQQSDSAPQTSVNDEPTPLPAFIKRNRYSSESSSAMSGVRKGILKSRSISESSCDDCMVNYMSVDSHLLSMTRTSEQLRQITMSSGLADMISSSDMHSPIDQDEDICSSEHPENGDCTYSHSGPDTTSPLPSGPRRRVNSACGSCAAWGYESGDSLANELEMRRRSRLVNFSKKDDKMNFCPLDSISQLHHSLANKRKKARKHDRKRHKSFNEGSTTDNIMGSQKNKKCSFSSSSSGKVSVDQPEPADIIVFKEDKEAEPVAASPFPDNEISPKSPPVALTSDVIFELDEN